MADAVLIPIYNEEASVSGVLDSVRDYFSGIVIAVDDGSTDRSREILSSRDDVTLIAHPRNLGYGRSLISGFEHARALGMERLVTMDCDGQHEPRHIPVFLEALDRSGVEIVSGSRYLPSSPELGRTPPDRQRVNAEITALVNEATGWSLTDAFCGFKAYRVSALSCLKLNEAGYAMPLELWAAAHRCGFRVGELPIERIYYDQDRSFGLDLDAPERRLDYYRRVFSQALDRSEPS